MTSPRPERRTRRFQFGLRKLLLWTGVVALLLGILKVLNLPILVCVLVDCWVIVVAVVRATSGATAAAVLSVAFGVVAVVAVLFIVPSELGITPDGTELVLAAPELLLNGVGLGLYVLALVELAFRGVNWTDKMLEANSDGETRRE